MGENKEVEVVKKIFAGTEVFSQEEYDSLIEDLKDILTEGVTAVRERVIETKWEIGDRLLREEGKLNKESVCRVTLAIHVSERELQFCLAFRKKYPKLKEMWERLPEGKNISWHKLVHNYIDFSLPKLEIPVEEKFDEWGLTDWWQKQKGLIILRIKSKQGAFALLVRVAKIAEADKAKMSEKINEVYEEITNFYIGVKKWKKTDLDRNDYGRIRKAIKAMLEKANFDKEKVIDAIKWCYIKYKDAPHIDWTIETVLKKYPEAVKNHVKK
jgi:hypothetical protein